jgi:hypothetical protein
MRASGPAIRPTDRVCRRYVNNGRLSDDAVAPLAGEERADTGSGLVHHVLTRLVAGLGTVRRDDQVRDVVGQQRVIEWRRLDAEDVDNGAAGRR